MLRHKLPQARLQQIIGEAVAVEKKFVDESLPVGLIGYTPCVIAVASSFQDQRDDDVHIRAFRRRPSVSGAGLPETVRSCEPVRVDDGHILARQDELFRYVACRC